MSCDNAHLALDVELYYHATIPTSTLQPSCLGHRVIDSNLSHEEQTDRLYR